MAAEFAAVVAVLETYLDGLYQSDTARLRRALHPQAIYVCATGEELVHLTMDAYLPIVDRRQSPASRSEPRRDVIVSIEFAGPKTAVARVNCAVGEKYFTDLLTLIHRDGRWQIIAKVFHYDLIA
jgi:hypothetical protein